MLVAAPFFKTTTLIPQAKIFLAIILSVWITASYWQQQPEIEFHLWYMVALVFKEFLVGVAMGFAANTVFFAARFAGGLIDFNMGYQTAMMFNQAATPTLVGEVKEFATIMLFLFLNGHHYLIEGVYASIQAVPLTTMAFTGSTVELLIKMATTVLILGVKIASPILVALFLTNLSLALLARVAPQTNIFILSFQLKVFVGLIVLIAAVPLFIYVIKIALGTVQSEMYQMILSLNPTRV